MAREKNSRSFFPIAFINHTATFCGLELSTIQRRFGAAVGVSAVLPPWGDCKMTIANCKLICASGEVPGAAESSLRGRRRMKRETFERVTLIAHRADTLIAADNSSDGRESNWLAPVAPARSVDNPASFWGVVSARRAGGRAAGRWGVRQFRGKHVTIGCDVTPQ